MITALERLMDHCDKTLREDLQCIRKLGLGEHSQPLDTHYHAACMAVQMMKWPLIDA